MLLYLNYLIQSILCYFRTNELKKMNTLFQELTSYRSLFFKETKNTFYEWMLSNSIVAVENTLKIGYLFSTGQHQDASKLIVQAEDIISTKFSRLFFHLENKYKFSQETNQDILILLSFQGFIKIYKVLLSLTMGEYKISLETLSELKKLIENYPHLKERYEYHLYLLIGICCVELKKFQLANTHLDFIVKNCKLNEIVFWAKLVKISNLLGKKLEQNEKEKIFDVLDELNNHSECNIVLGYSSLISYFRGLLCDQNGANNDALLHFNNAYIKSDESIMNQQLTSQICYSIGNNYFLKQDYLSSRMILNKSLKITKDPILEELIYKDLEKLSKELEEEEEKIPFDKIIKEKKEKISQNFEKIKDFKDDILNFPVFK